MLIITDSKIPHAESAFKHFGEVRALPTKAMTRNNIKHATAILVRSETTIDAELLDDTHVRFVGTATIGTDHVDEEYLKQRDIAFASCPGSNANSVGEYILAALLEVSHRHNFSLKGKTLGVVGHGNTGSRVAKKAIAIGMNVLLNDPPLSRSTKDERYIPLDALMNADFISLHVPLTKSGEDATFHLFDEKRLMKMKRGSILLNSSRGAVVETRALKRALISNHLRASVLDVWEDEPKIDVELLERVTLGSPHIAGYSYDGKLNATRMLQHAIAEAFHFSLPKHEQAAEAELTELTPHEQTDKLEPLVRSLVKQCYDIEEDDRNLRALSTLASSERADYFRTLRSQYRMRREFHNFIVDGTQLDEESRTTLAALGFTIRTLKDAA